MKLEALNTALLAVIAATLMLLVWLQLSAKPLTASDIALAVLSPELCRNPAVKPAQLEP